MQNFSFVIYLRLAVSHQANQALPFPPHLPAHPASLVYLFTPQSPMDFQLARRHGFRDKAAFFVFRRLFPAQQLLTLTWLFQQYVWLRFSAGKSRRADWSSPVQQLLSRLLSRLLKSCARKRKAFDGAFTSLSWTQLWFITRNLEPEGLGRHFASKVWLPVPALAF